MTPHEPPTDVFGPLRDATRRNLALPDNDETIIRESVHDAVQMYLEHQFHGVPGLSHMELLEEHFKGMYQREGRRNGTRLKNSIELYDGSTPTSLNLVGDFDNVITICNAETLNSYFVTDEYESGRKTLLGAITDQDLLLMDEQSRINAEKANRRHQLLSPHLKALAVQVRQFGNFRRWHESLTTTVR